MKQLFLVATLLVLGTATQGCVVKTTSSGDPASPASNTSPAAAPADPPPAPSPAAPAPAAAPAKPAASPASAPAPAPAKPATPALAGAKQVDTSARPAQPAPAPTARPAQPAPAPSAPQKDAAVPPKKKIPQPVFTAPPKPKAQPSERKAADANGVPPSMKEGAQLAYWIWRDKDGVTWHLRTTAGGPDHRFSGRIWVDGTLSDLKAARLETNDRLKKEDEGVLVFDFVTNTAMDGFDFKVASGRCVTFHLLIDGKPAPQEVEIGQKEISVGSATFRLCR